MSGANLEATKGDKICGAGNLSDLGHKFSPDSSRSESGKQRFLSLPSPLSTKLFHLLTFIFNAAAAFGCIGVAKLSALFSSGLFRKKKLSPGNLNFLYRGRTSPDFEMKAQVLFKPYKFGSGLRELGPRVCFVC